MQMTAENSLEDYWEDASVSWGCRGLSFSPCPPKQQQEVQDFHIAASTLRPRNFPPPIALCSTLSIKAGGRFVLKEMVSLPSHGLRAEREQGRLFLHFIEPQQLDDEEDDDDDDYDNFCNLEEPLVCTDHHQQEQHDGCEALRTEDINGKTTSHEKANHDTIQSIPQEPVCVGEAFSDGMPEKHVHTKDTLINDENNDIESAITEKHGMEHIEIRDNNIGPCIPSIASEDVESKECAAKHIEIKNDSIGDGAPMGVPGIHQHQRASLWSKEGSNDITTSISPCVSKQVLSFARTSPALGLAVS